MKEGLLWYDSRGIEDVREKVLSAVDYFSAKYGCLPEKCYVHPDELEKGSIELDNKVKVVQNPRVTNNHIWLEFPSD